MEWNLSKDERFYEISRRSRMTVFFFLVKIIKVSHKGMEMAKRSYM